MSTLPILVDAAWLAAHLDDPDLRILDSTTNVIREPGKPDHVVAERLEAGVPVETLSVDDPAIGDRMGLDIGPATIQAYAAALADAKTVVWNGPMGVFEIEAFAKGTVAVAQAVAEVHGTTIVGGGDSIAAVKAAGVADRITHISTGGGASLEFLAGENLPGVAVLPEA